MSERASFEQLLSASNRIQDDELDEAIKFLRHRRAGISGNDRFAHLASIVNSMDHDALGWLEAVLCARCEQSERNASRRRHAHSSFRE